MTDHKAFVFVETVALLLVLACVHKYNKYCMIIGNHLAWSSSTGCSVQMSYMHMHMQRIMLSPRHSRQVPECTGVQRHCTLLPF